MAAGGSGGVKGKWSIGLVNGQNLYLSAEKFQFKVNASGKSMKMKQIWTLEKQDEDSFALKSWLGRYLGCDKAGLITAEATEIGAENIFLLVDQGDARFEIRSSQGHSLGGSHDDIKGTLRDPKPEGWAVHLAMVPQINLWNIQRKAYARLSSDETQIEVKEEIPWGERCIIFFEYKNGRYCFRDINSRYLSRDGSFKAAIDNDCLFILYLKQTSIAFQDSQGKYLSCVGPRATLQASRKDTAGQAELFEISNAKPQVTLLASNQKFLSNRQGTDVRANQFEAENTEIFQLEAADTNDRSGNVKWAFRGFNKKYWAIEGNSLACNSENFTSATSQFEIVWKEEKVFLKSSNGRFISASSGGQLSPIGSEEEECCGLTLQMINRPLVAFNGCFGFVGIKGASGVLECNRSQAEFFKLTSEGSKYYIQVNDANGKYWDATQGGISATAVKPVAFSIEFRAHNRVCIVAPNGQYLRGSQNGGFTASGGNKVEDATLWTI